MGEAQGILLCIQRGYCLWRNLAKKQYKKRQYAGCRSHCLASHHIRHKHCKDGRRGKVDHIVADQDGAQHLALILSGLQYPASCLIAIVCKISHTNQIHRCKGGFR